MSGAYPHLFTPLRVGRIALENRLVMGSMHTALERHADGFERLAAFYAERARGGAALIVTGGFSPDAVGALGHDPAQVFDRPEQIPGHRRITDAVHAAGSRVLLQLLHGGRYSRHAGNLAPSAVPSRINKHVPRAMTTEEIAAAIAAFARSAALAREAGYDGVELMGSEGYLLTQFATPFTNRREDEWGGDIAGRGRFPCAVTAAVRAATGPDFLVMYRISTLDLVPHGNTWDETVTLAQALEAAGVDVFNTGIGWHEARIPTIAHMVPRAAFAATAGRLRATVTVPVMASNRINDPATAEALVANGEADLVSLARALLADPRFPAKAKAGQAARINTCIGCNQACLDAIFSGADCSCMVNPRAGRETERVPPAARARHIAVVGGGPAGLACAAEAARRGHLVTLYEAAPHLGGQFNLAAAVPGKGDYAETVRYFAAELADLGVDVRTGHAARAADLAGHDEVVLACGVRPRVPELPGVDHPCVLDYTQVLSGQVAVGARVAILGAGGIGVDTALFLTGAAHDDAEVFLREWGVDLTVRTPGGLVPPQPAPARREVHLCWRGDGPPGDRLGITTAWVHRMELERRRVHLHPGVRYLGVDDAGLHIERGGERCCLAVDHVVLCAGQQPQDALHAELAALGVSAHLIGGARSADGLNAVRAIAEGTALAQRL